MTIVSHQAGFGMAEEKDPIDCSPLYIRNPACFREKFLPFFFLFSLFFPTSLFTEVFAISFLQFVSKSCCVNAVRDAVLIPLLLMLFSFGERMAPSLTCFLLSLIPLIPQPSWLAAFADPYFNGLSSVCLRVIWEKWL